MSRAVVLGGGFAGIESAITLRKLGVPTTLVSDREFGWIYPISIWVPIGGIEPDDARISLARLAKVHGFDLIVDAVQSIDVAGKTVQLGSQTLGYDYLVLAMGGAKMRPKGIEHTFTICGQPDETVQLRDALAEVVARGGGRLAFGFGGNPQDTSAVRGGPVFELMFNVEHWLRKQGVRDKFALHFFAPMPEPGKKMGPKAMAAMGGFYERARVERHIGVKITHFTEGAVHFADDSVLEADLIVFVPAGKGLPIFGEAGLPVSEVGYVRTDRQCRVVGHDNIWAVGDAAELQGPEWRAKQGHVAEVMARIAANDLALAIQSGGQERCPDDYVEHVNILCLMDTGDGAAMVKRDLRGSSIQAYPIIGHWMKKGWGTYWKMSKLKQIPRLPGM